MLAAAILQPILQFLVFAQDPAFTVLPGSASVQPVTVRMVTRLGEEGLERLSPFFPGTRLSGLVIYLHPDLDSVPEDVRRHLHPGTAGLALLNRNQIHLLLDEARLQPPGDLRTVVDHELVHMLLHAHSGEGADFVPRWFHEGLAQEMSGAAYLGMREADIAIPAQTMKLLRFSDLRTGFPKDNYGLRLAYGQSFSYVAFLKRKVGLETLLRAARMADREQWFRNGFLSVTGAPLVFQEELWRDYLVNDSGALWRRMRSDCFAYLMIPGTVLLVWATRRAVIRDRRSRLRLEQAEVDNREDLGA